MGWFEDLIDRLLNIPKPHPPAGPTPEEIEAARVEKEKFLAAIKADCYALWKDELKREPTEEELADYTAQFQAGVSQEQWRTHLRTTDEYKALQRPPVATVQGITTRNRKLYRADGSIFVWKGITSFRLAEMLAMGHEVEVIEYMNWAQGQGVTVLRVLLMAKNLFVLSPEVGLTVLDRLLDLAQTWGLYVEVVILADTASYPDLNIDKHVRLAGAICANHSNVFIELGNELAPVHQTQNGKLGDIPYLETLRRSIPSNVLVSLGSTHGGNDESQEMKGGDYLTIHGDRSDGDNGWRWVRHSNEQRVVAEATNRFAVNDECKRDDLSADKQLGIAILCRMFGLGDTFHYGGGLQSTIAVGAELEALQARRRGWAAIPDQWEGRYMNAGFAGSPVRGFSKAVRVYSSISGGHGYTLVLGAEGEPNIEWNWARRNLLISNGGMRLYEVNA